MSRTAPLDAWLEDYDAREMWIAPVRHVGKVHAYIIGDKLVLVLRYSRGGGWDLFIPASTDPSVATTLDAATAALGLS